VPAEEVAVAVVAVAVEAAAAAEGAAEPLRPHRRAALVTVVG
jgi:hypothetical protein